MGWSDDEIEYYTSVSGWTSYLQLIKNKQEVTAMATVGQTKSEAVLTGESNFVKPSYVGLQVRFDSNSGSPRLKIQGKGKPVNRDYGVSEVFSLEAGSPLAEWVRSSLTGGNSVKSLASNETYFVAEARRDQGGTVRMHLYGPGLNRVYGACVTITAPKDLEVFLLKNDGSGNPVLADEDENSDDE